jgi:hypothetical protein
MISINFQIPAVGLLAVLSSMAFAQSSPFVGRGIDPNTFIVGHPASPTWSRPHTNAEHPAVQVAERTKHQVAAIDPNTFTVQPPASVRWLASGEASALAIAAAR